MLFIQFQEILNKKRCHTCKNNTYLQRLDKILLINASKKVKLPFSI
uniref:Uncharacterized protein n=1 Tax=Arundo donax TaxID=35708 RepID=A0A0A8ZY34_ARUDO